MDAGRLHSAVNFGTSPRIQLVVRKLLSNNQLNRPVKVRIYWEVLTTDRARFLLDNHISPWLNTANKNSDISNFSFTDSSVTFEVEERSIPQLTRMLPEHFKIEYL
jgi:hypothetical protein